ncbi:hypothetical protein A4S05_32210 [Nostoc sp. KVJ20]|uniref:restriction endonuclease subunit S n=1 Tax=Nostoc sp. KVJ20 TaxID=457944 RepID=UPI00083DEB4B|nr:restriction endonuclease subunit S [Nostoc sp. KVJ20]ODH00646.1 hypothetical protein A4S05_32210 [Nostoc sp. KVJ20]
MAFPKYESYKDSGEDWLGEVPEHWEVKSLSSILINRNEKNEPVKTKDILSLSIASGVTPYSDENRGGNKAKNDLTAYKLAYPGDIVLNSMNVVVGAVGLSKYFGAISPVYYALYLRNKEKTSIDFYSYIFSNSTFQKYLFQYGKGILVKKSDSGKLNTIRMKISMQDLKKVPLPLPPITEQKRIVEFLDHKTSEIDEAIAKKQRLIKLLQEQKAILINQAVTKGLNPKATMRDSGVEWVGEIPEHWEVARLKTLMKKMDQGWSPQCFNYPADDNQWGVLKVGCVNGYQFNSTENKVLPPNLKPISELEIKHKDILISRANTIELVGSAACILEPRKKLLISDKLFRVLADEEKVMPEFLVLLLQVRTARMQIEIGANGASFSMQNIGRDVIRNIWSAIPPVCEQKEILNLVLAINDQSRRMTAAILKEIEVMTEFKYTLIANIVTGKILI